MNTKDYRKINVESLLKQGDQIIIEKLRHLIDQHVRIMDTGFCINISEDTDLWHECLQGIGVHNAYRLIAHSICRRYQEQFQKEFLFSDECVAYEIEYHTDAFMSVNGYKGYVSNITTMLMSKDFINRHCDCVDISTLDVHNTAQKLMFGYENGIRECYKGTEEDPYQQNR